MNSIHGIVPVGTQAWKGVRVLRVDALPATLPAGLQGEVLTCCQNEGVSIELCLTTAAGAPGEVTALILLRAVSRFPYEALDRLEHARDMVLQRLATANIRCHEVDADSGEVLCLERFFGGDLSAVSAAQGFFPAEGGPDSGNAYVPGQYAAPDTKRVDLGGLITLLSYHSDALLSLQMNVAQLSPDERRLVKANRRWFAAWGDAPGARSGVDAFSRLEQAAAVPLFLVCISCFGSERCVRDVSNQLRLSGMQSYHLPRPDLRNEKYALRGNEWIPSACIRCGHAPHVPRNMLPRMGRFTHLAPLGAACAAFALPQNASSVRGIHINRIPASREPLPAALTRQDGVYLGRAAGSGLSVFLPPDDLTRHGFIVGKPGSGKTTFALGLLFRLYNHKNRYPFLAFEPAKTEYRSLLERIPELQIYTPGRQDVAPIQLNPFLPPKGVRLEQYQQNLEAIFSMALSMDHPLDIIFPQVVARCYARYGWRPDSTRESAGTRIFGMHEFIREFRRYIRESYAGDPETLHNLENGGVVRLMALMKSPMFDTDRSLDVEALLEKPAVIELDALNSAGEKALVMGVLLTQIMLVLQRRGNSHGRLRNVILVDEAHLMLNQSEGGPGPAQAVVDLLQNMTLILRAYGAALLFGDQSPARLTSVITDNVDLKVMYRLDSRQDRALLAETALMSDGMAESMATLPAGEAFLHCSALSAPVHIATPNAEDALKLNRALPDERVRRHMQIALEAPFSQCARCGCCGGRCDPAIRAAGQFLASQLIFAPEVAQCLTAPERQGALSAFLEHRLPDAVSELQRRFQMPGGDPRTVGCAKAQFVRALLISPRFALTKEALLGEGGAERAEDAAGAQERFQARVTPENILALCALDASPDAQPGRDAGEARPDA